MEGDSRRLRVIILLALAVLLPLLGLNPRPHRFDQGLQQAQQAAARGNYVQAAQLLGTAAEQMPWRMDLWELAGRYALRGGESQPAIEYFQRALQLTNTSIISSTQQLSPVGLADMGQAHQQNGDLAAALQTWQIALKVLDTDRAVNSSVPADIKTSLAQSLLEVHLVQGDKTAAVSDLQLLMELQPDQAKWPYQLGLLKAVDEPETALEHLERAARLDPGLEPAMDDVRRAILRADLVNEPAYTLVEIGRSLAGLGEWKLAEYAFQQAVNLRPDYAEAWAYLGEARQHTTGLTDTPTADSQAGLIELEKALELNSTSLSANSFQALYWLRHNRPDLAVPLMRAAAQTDPENPALQSELARVLALSGDIQGAEAAYRQAIALAPFDSLYVRALVEFSLLYDYQINQIALPTARQLVAEAPDEPANLDLIAQVLIKQGDLSNADRFLRRALQIDPDYAPAHLHVGLVYVLSGQRSTGWQAWQQAIQIAPESSTAAQARRLLEAYFP